MNEQTWRELPRFLARFFDSFIRKHRMRGSGPFGPTRLLSHHRSSNMRLNKLINRIFPKPRTIRRRREVFGRLEQLECRTLPSVNWIGGNDDWSASVNNWLDTAD